jgi:hypothetical protein
MSRKAIHNENRTDLAQTSHRHPVRTITEEVANQNIRAVRLERFTLFSMTRRESETQPLTDAIIIVVDPRVGDRDIV